ncbi:MAG: type II toxin-antitoxin system RelE/ParE family toxin [Proteobacteria bacterium]|nr:type II toxin-antitoxin system RelE/ParE family toxin [Pseudomonadota bacterium]
MNTLIRSTVFVAWLDGLSDAKGKARVLSRLGLASLGNFGDCKPVGEGVSEMRIDVGPGYRVYYCRREERTYLLLAGGDKSNQDRDIKRAKEMAGTLKQETNREKGKKGKGKS